jgi:hypothetical protein
MNYNNEPIIPIEPQPIPPSHRPPAARPRRRRIRRLEIPRDAGAQAELIVSLSRRAYPSYELFVYALLCGAVLGLGFLLDSQPILLFAILLAPLMTPWVGMLLAILTGSIRFFLETLMALLVSAALVFIGGVTAGFASRPFQPLTFNNAYIHSHLWVPELVVLAFGAILLTISFVRSEEKPFLPSVLVAYGFYLPIGAGAFGLGSGVPGIWPQGILLFLAHLGFATIFGLLALFILRFKPSFGGLIFAGMAGIVIAAGLVILMGPGPTSANEAENTPQPQAAFASQPTLEPAATSTALSPLLATPTPRLETATPETISPVPLTIEVTLPATETPTITLTIEPTPVYAKINASQGGGANLRKTPNGRFIATLDNGMLVQVLPDIEEVSGVPWAHVIATKYGTRLEGWVLQSVLATATPIVNWQPSDTPPALTPSATPSITIPTIGVTPAP